MAVRVLLLGQVGSGKSYLAGELAALKKGVVLPFAKDVYRLASIVKGAHIDKSRREDRELLKIIGTTWGRESREVAPEIEEKLREHKPEEWGSPHIWAKIFIANCRSLPEGTSIINDDTRFLNELEISMAVLGFIPVFVACSEVTRQERLRSRGDAYDPSATDHLSEEMANFLRGRVLTDSSLPAVWNDRCTPKPDGSWIFEHSDFRRAVDASASNAELASKLQWNPERARLLIASIRENLAQPTGDFHV